MKDGKLCILLIVGGDSAERDVSLETGKEVYKALHALGHHVLVADPMRTELEASVDPSPFFEKSRIGEKPPVIGRERYRCRTGFLENLSHYDRLGCDLVFNALHGGSGEDGTFQAVLEYLGIRFTGSGSVACALAMNKEISKRIASLAGVPSAKHVFMDGSESGDPSVEERVLSELAFPVVVKPNREGSSVGVTVVASRERLAAALDEARAFGPEILIEEYIPGCEVTAAVIDHEELPLIEIRPRDGFYDYRNKYQGGTCDYLVPAPLDRKVADAVSRSARQFYRALGCRGYARIDFRVTEGGRHCLLECNTLPGLTSHSLVPKAAKAVGIDYTQLVKRILDLSMAA